MKAPTPAQRRALEDIRDHGNPYARAEGRSQHGGMQSVIRAIRSNDWARVVDVPGQAWTTGAQSSWGLTDAGRLALKVLQWSSIEDAQLARVDVATDGETTYRVAPWGRMFALSFRVGLVPPRWELARQDGSKRRHPTTPPPPRLWQTRTGAKEAAEDIMRSGGPVPNPNPPILDPYGLGSI